MSIFYQSRIESCRSFISYNNTYPSHLHKQLELFYVLEGSIEITIEQQSYTLNPGDVSLTFPNLVHASSTPQNSKVLLIHFDASFLSEYSYEFTKYKPTMPVVKASVLHPVTMQILENLVQICSETAPYTLPDKKKHSLMLEEKNKRSMLKGMLLIVLSDLMSHMTLTADTSLSADTSQKILVYLDNHITEELTLTTVSKALGLNKYYLSHIFSDKLKLSFPEYISLKRLELACHLLTDSNFSITDIAYEAGFSSSRSFYRHFKEKYDCTPSEYRNKHS